MVDAQRNNDLVGRDFARDFTLSEIVNDQASIKAFIHQKEADADSERKRAEVAEAALLQKELEVAGARQREEEMKQIIESMKVQSFPLFLSLQGVSESGMSMQRTQEEFRRSQALAQQEMLAKFEQIKVSTS